MQLTGQSCKIIFFGGNSVKSILVLGAAALSVAACTTPYAPIPYDRATAGVESIQIVETSFPETATTQKLATNGQNMASAMAAGAGLAGVLVGAIAAGVEANIEAGQRKRILAALETQDFDGEAIFDAALEAALTGSDYTVETVDLPRESQFKLIEITADPVAPDGTAILDVAGSGYGYQLVGGNTQWRPFASAQVRLTNPQDPTVIHLDNKVVYNPVATPDVIVNIPPNEIYAFNKIEDIEANPELAAEGLKEALEETAKAVAQLLQ